MVSTRLNANRIAMGITVTLFSLMGACSSGHIRDQVSATTASTTEKATAQEWYSGGLSDSTSMSEWTHASNRDQLATAADIAVKGLELKYGSTRAAMQKLGTMESLLPYAVEVLECMNTAVKGSPDITDADWQKILEKQTVRDFGVGCLAMLKVQGGANSDF